MDVDKRLHFFGKDFRTMHTDAGRAHQHAHAISGAPCIDGIEQSLLLSDVAEEPTQDLRASVSHDDESRCVSDSLCP